MDRAIARDGNDSQQRISEVDLDRITTGTMRLDASNNQQAHALIYCHVDYMVCCDNIGHVPVDC